MMKQYREARESLEPDTLLLFRLGDFYEMFEIDAERGAALLGITLTKRHDMPMAGIPSHAAEGYLTKLLALGHKVAICDQLEPPKPGKLVKRGITRILTPGTVLEDGQLEGERNHFLLALELDDKGARASWHDFLSVLSSLSPKEVLVPEGFEQSLSSLALESSFRDELERVLGEVTRTERPGFDFDQRSGAREVMESLGVMNLEGFGIDSGHPALGAAGAVLVYAQDVLRGKPGNLSRIEEFRDGEALLLDPATQRNLEIFRTTSQARKGSLLDAMDQTVSPAGARLLERYLASPERDLSEIRRRQGCVAEFSRANTVVEELGAILRTGSDLERILGRLRNRLVRPRELGGLRATVRGLPGIRKILLELGDDFPSIQALSSGVDTFDDLRELLDRALEEELPPEIKVDVKGEGGRVIRAGFDEDFDRLRELGSGGKKWIVDLEASEREKTGISNLKVKYNGAFGYFIEVTKANLHLVPDEYVRKQTMTNAERFYTEELRQKEKEIVNAEESSVAREQELFLEVVESALQYADSLARTAEVLAEIDLFASWGSIMRDRDYCLPEFEEGLDSIEIEQGRHPVVESVLKSESLGLAGTHAFVPNDCFLSSGEEQICLITGPNMAGKSTFIRQVALLALMAQVGSAVPAKMNETANILNNCSSSSLIVLDEIGRGTSTYDGLSIAWAVIEHIHGRKEKGPKTLFATHYHELTKLADSLPRLRNFSVAVKEWNDEIIFMRQVAPGASERSFGIQVARLAGLPEEVVERSKEILAGLEKGERSGKDPGPGEDKPVSLPLPRNGSGPSTQEEDHPPKPPARKPRKRQDPSQLELF